jgi:broad specificity phosphatase PhoE
MNKTFYIFRHGKAVADGEEYGENNQETKLLPEGIKTIGKLAKYISENVPESENFSSTWPRCVESSSIVTEITGRNFNFDTRLTEFYEEDFQTFHERVSNFLNDILDSESRNFLICTHGAVIAAFKHLVLDGKVDRQELMDYPAPGDLLILGNGESKVEHFS